jgi:hypothetical protein
MLRPSAPSTLQEWCKNGSVFDIVRKAELELAGQAAGVQQAFQVQ